MSGRCPACGGLTPIGANCVVTGTPCFDVTGSGTEADPFVIDIPLADGYGYPDSQLADCGDDGLSATLPSWLTNPPACQAYHSVNQTIGTGVVETVNLNSELYDTDGMHSPTTNNSRITFNTAGVYTVSFQCAWAKKIFGDRQALIRKNGSTVLATETKKMGDSTDLVIGHALTIIEEFDVADYIEARVMQSCGANLLLVSESYSPILTVQRVA